MKAARHAHKNGQTGMTAFHHGVGVPHAQPAAFHTNVKHIPRSVIGSNAAGAETVFNKKDVTGGMLSIGTPLSGPQSHGKFRRMGKKRGY